MTSLAPFLSAALHGTDGAFRVLALRLELKNVAVICERRYDNEWL